MRRNERRQASIVLSKWPPAAGSRHRKASAPCTPRAISAALNMARPSGREETVEHRLVDAGQRLEVGDRALLVDLVHALADQPEFDDRAVAADEARVRRPAGGREFGFDTGHVADRAGHEFA